VKYLGVLLLERLALSKLKWHEVKRKEKRSKTVVESAAGFDTCFALLNQRRRTLAPGASVCHCVATQPADSYYNLIIEQIGRKFHQPA